MAKNRVTREQYVNHKTKIEGLIKGKKGYNNKPSSDKYITKVRTKIYNKKIRDVEVIFFTTGSLSPDINRSESADIDVDGHSTKIKYVNYDIDSFWDMVDKLEANKNFNDYVKGKSLVFNVSGPRKFIEHEKDMSYTLSINVRDLYNSVLKFLKDDKSNINSLTHKNVRDYLGNKDKKNNYNNGIIKTVKDKNDGKYFYAYHMGMVLLGENLKIKNDKEFIVESPSFVNGAQSLGSIMSIESADEIHEDAEVNVRIVSFDADSSQTKLLSDKIVLRTNSANPITWEMKYAFDNNQKYIAQLLARKGYLYDYRKYDSTKRAGIATAVKNRAKQSIENNSWDKQESLLPRKNIIKPHDLSRAIYIVENSDSITPYNKPDSFKYETNFDDDSIYANSFYLIEDSKKTTRPYKEYLYPLSILNMMESRIAQEFPKNATESFKSKSITIKAGSAKTMKYFLTVYFYKLKGIKNAVSLVEYVDGKTHDEIKEDIKEFLSKFRDGLYDGKSELPNFKIIFKKICDDSKTVGIAKGFNWDITKW
ncbi:MAG: AIPR family protein, partial [Mycoplasmataceae bacterium]|nr:AIPR family protein [Mycoplasmataceae bacterium]